MELLSQLASFTVFPNVLAAIVGLPSALLYLLEVLIICCCSDQPQFKSGFFRLVVARALTSIFNMVTSYWGLRFGLLGMFYPLFKKMPKLFLNFFFFTSYYTYHVENLCTSCLLLNRFSSIAFIYSYEAFWRKWLPLGYLLIFGLPMAAAWPMFSVDMEVHFLDDKNVSFGILNVQAEFPYALFVAYTGAAFVAICVGLNVASWLVYRRKYANLFASSKSTDEKGHQQQQQQGTPTDLNNKVERHLFLYTFCTFLCQLVMALHYYGVYLSNLYAVEYRSPEAALFSDILYHNYGLVNDISTVVVPAWLLLLTCAKMRQILAFQLVQLRQYLHNSIRPMAAVPTENGNETSTSKTPNGCARLEDGRLHCENNFVAI